MKRIVKSMILVLVLSLLCGCGKTSTVRVADTSGDGKLTCTLEIRCDTLLGKLDQMTSEKAALVPDNGILLETVELEFSGGESVFDVFRKTLREEKIHFEYMDASAYDSVYIEGIGNIYEFDCGSQSGWMYSVNGIYPGLGCSAYTLADGDVIVFNYTCDLGADLGADYEKLCLFRVPPGGEFHILPGSLGANHVHSATGVPADLIHQRVRLFALFAGEEGFLPAGWVSGTNPDHDGHYESRIQP